MKRKGIKQFRTFLCTAALVSAFFAVITIESAIAAITLSPSLPSGAPVGSNITWTAFTDYDLDAIHYRYKIQRIGGPEMIVRDFDIYSSFDWTPLEEGMYNISVVARDISGELQETKTRYLVSSRVAEGDPVITATQHPLVALYSVPITVSGAEVRVQFRVQGDETWKSTPYKRCKAHRSTNFLVAGMVPETDYEMRHEITVGNHIQQVSGISVFTTGASEIPDWGFSVTYGPGPDTSLSDDVIVHAVLFGGEGENVGLGCPVATDLNGNLLWYFKKPLDFMQYAGSFLMSFPPSMSGTFLIPMSRPPIPDVIPGPIRGQLLREIDLAGNTIRETNVERINEQLIAMGYDPIYYFHHDARRLPNGHTLVMAGVERILEDVQGSGPVDVVGDAIIDLDKNFQVVWAWNTFDHDELPVTRRALRDEECTGAPGVGNVCGPLRLLGDGPDQAPVAHDWTHGNTVTYAPADGSIIVSFRHQDWLIKIDYDDGKGAGNILWRLGNEGDFDIEQAHAGPYDSHPWFSGQHQPMVYAQNEIVIYDNSNARNENGDDSVANSRGQVYILDEKGGTATLVTNADLGVYASFLGSAQKLSNGNYHFLSGGIAGDQPSPVPGFPAGLSESTETSPAGEITYTLQAPHHTTYRSFRMKGMYRPAGIPGDVDGDSDVDRFDLILIKSKINQQVDDPDDPCDLNGDGSITFEDMIEAKSQCTLPSCKPLNWVDTVKGY
ncbi:aryl-sulfate sulfotransferase [Desulfosediminicola sp.]|uniref:aryl-sulfate sulfotransferase n=1 Tax=Desulfosediminicola sp. TaxID=2886825 RepID=UPI003AF23A08